MRHRMKHPRVSQFPVVRRWPLLAVALISVGLAGVMGYVTMRDLGGILNDAQQAAALGMTSALRTELDLAITSTIIDVLLNLYLLGAALVIAGLALRRCFGGRPADDRSVNPAALLLIGGFTWFTSGFMLILLLHLVVRFAHRAAGLPIDSLRDLIFLAVTIALAVTAAYLALRRD